MDYTTADPRINGEQTKRSAATGQQQQQRQHQNQHQNQNQSQSLPFASNNQEQSTQMSSAAGPLPGYHPSEYQTNPTSNLPHQQQQQQQHGQQAPQHAGYQQYSSQGYIQQQPNQMTSSHFQGHQHDYATQAFSQQQGQLQAPPQPPYQQSAYNVGGGAGAGGGAQNSGMHSNAHLTMQTPMTQRSGARPLTERPVIKLSLNLIDTYKRINDAYYERKRVAAVVERAEKQTEPRGQGVHNHGWDDEHYDYILRSEEIIGERYELKERIGKGSFGQVVKAFDITTKKHVAIKIIKSRRPFTLQARTEIDLLTHLKNQDPEDQSNIVRLLSAFEHKSHQCLVFEMLSLNLYELLKNTQFDGVSINLIRKFAKQILKALQFLANKSVDVIHCDLKPENILLRHPKRSGIKVIDFGSSCRSNNQMYSYIQSRFYRSPEVLLGLPYTVAIDVWSLGCILVEMHTGEPLFSGSDQFDQMRKIVKILGMVPDDIVIQMKEQQRNQFFEKSADGHWTLKTPADATQEPAVPSSNPRESLKAILRRSNDSGDYDIFVEMIYRMLSFRPSERINPTQALAHPFITKESVLSQGQ